MTKSFLTPSSVLQWELWRREEKRREAWEKRSVELLLTSSVGGHQGTKAIFCCYTHKLFFLSESESERKFLQYKKREREREVPPSVGCFILDCSRCLCCGLTLANCVRFWVEELGEREGEREYCYSCAERGVQGLRGLRCRCNFNFAQ